MELIFALLLVGFFVVLNHIRIGLLGDENSSSEFFISFSTIIFGVVYSFFV